MVLAMNRVDPNPGRFLLTSTNPSLKFCEFGTVFREFGTVFDMSHHLKLSKVREFAIVFRAKSLIHHNSFCPGPPPQVPFFSWKPPDGPLEPHPTY